MSSYHGNNERCENCGIKYKDFRCSISTFQEAVDAMYSPSEDPKDWVYRRKPGVLRFWCGVKKKEWELHKQQCQLNENEYEEVSEIDGY